MKTIKVDLSYIRPNSSFIYALYSDEGKKILNPRIILTPSRIKRIIDNYGHVIYYNKSEFGSPIPQKKLKVAYSTSKEIMDEVSKTQTISNKAYTEAEVMIEDILGDLESTEVDSIDLLKDLRSYEEYTYNHSVNVGLLSAIFAIKMEVLSKDEIKYLTLGAYLHDIGKMKIDKQLLNKKGKLNISETNKMRRHPQLGYEIVRKVRNSNPIVEQSILFHHEKFNTKGYYKLPYEYLPVFSKIVSLCDIFDALTSNRPYRRAVSTPNTLKAIVNSINNHFDYNIISQFINMLSPILNNKESFYYKNEICELKSIECHSNELALIKIPGKTDLLKPQVLIFCNLLKNNKKTTAKFYKTPFNIDLQHDSSRKMIKLISNHYQIEKINKMLSKKLKKNLIEEI